MFSLSILFAKYLLINSYIQFLVHLQKYFVAIRICLLMNTS